MFSKLLRASAVAGVLAIAATSAAQDKLSKGDKKWMETEVGPIITAQEEAMFQEIQKGDRKLFKELFWMRRDFNPGTPKNEFEDGYKQRIKIADDSFGGRRRKGSESDMGQIFLLLGNPAQRKPGKHAGSGGLPMASDPMAGGGGESEEPGGENSPGNFGGGGGGGGGGQGSQTMSWIYDPNPGLGLPDGLVVEFRNQQNFGYRITNLDDIQEHLDRAKQRTISNPGINYARDEKGRLKKPDDKYDPNSPAKKALAALRETGTTSSDIDFAVNPMFFGSTAGQTFIPVDVVVMGGLSGKDATVFGSVENADGFEVFQFEEPAKLEEDSQGAMAFEMPLQFLPGLYTLNIGVMDPGSQVLGTQIIDLEVPDFSSGEFMISTVLTYTERVQVGEEAPHAGKAFNLAGSHLTPKRTKEYSKSEDIQGVFYVYGFGQPVDMTVQYVFWRGEQRRGASAAEPVTNAAEDFAVVPFGFPLSIRNFEEPGDYRVEVKLTDNVTGKNITQDVHFTVVGE